MENHLEKIIYESVRKIANSRAGRLLAGVALTGILFVSCGSQQDEGYKPNPYGCQSHSRAKLQPDGSYTSKVGMRFYEHLTGIIVSAGKTAAISSEGEGCWYSGCCSGPDGSSETWGLYAGLRRIDTGEIVHYGRIGSNANLLNDLGVDCELVLFIPDGSSDIGCVEEDYMDNSGHFTSTINTN